MGESAPRIDDHFYDRADEHIELANGQIDATATRGKVSASMMYAAARFNAWVSATTHGGAEQMRADRDERISFLCDQYRRMLTENYDDYVANFDDYMKP